MIIFYRSKSPLHSHRSVRTYSLPEHIPRWAVHKTYFIQYIINLLVETFGIHIFMSYIKPFMSTYIFSLTIFCLPTQLICSDFLAGATVVLPSILIGIGLTVSWNIISAERWIFGKPIKYFVPNWLWSVAMNLTLLAVFVRLCYATKDSGAHCLSDILFQPNIFFQTSKMSGKTFFLSITRTFFQLSLTDGFSSVYESLFEFFQNKNMGRFQ